MWVVEGNYRQADDQEDRWLAVIPVTNEQDARDTASRLSHRGQSWHREYRVVEVKEDG